MANGGYLTDLKVKSLDQLKKNLLLLEVTENFQYNLVWRNNFNK